MSGGRVQRPTGIPLGSSTLPGISTIPSCIASARVSQQRCEPTRSAAADSKAIVAAEDSSSPGKAARPVQARQSKPRGTVAKLVLRCHFMVFATAGSKWDCIKQSFWEVPLQVTGRVPEWPEGLPTGRVRETFQYL